MLLGTCRIIATGGREQIRAAPNPYAPRTHSIGSAAGFVTGSPPRAGGATTLYLVTVSKPETAPS